MTDLEAFTLVVKCEGLLLPFLSPLIQESDACRGSRPHSTGRIFDRLKNLTGHFVHTDFELLDG